jgi:hypothetical protein
LLPIPPSHVKEGYPVPHIQAGTARPRACSIFLAETRDGFTLATLSRRPLVRARRDAIVRAVKAAADRISRALGAA